MQLPSNKANRYLTGSAFGLTAAVIGAVLIAGTGISAQAKVGEQAQVGAGAGLRCPPNRVAQCNDGHFIFGPLGREHHCSHHQGIRRLCDSNR
jgi:hypothetical protein